MSAPRDLLQATTTCAYCPTLCLHACPVSTAEASSTVSPHGKMMTARALASGALPLTDRHAVGVLSRCTSCGACQVACRHAIDVSGTLHAARTWAATGGHAAVDPISVAVPIEAETARVLPPGASGVWLHDAGHAAAFAVVAKRNATRWGRRPELVFASVEDLIAVETLYPTVGATLRVPQRLEVDEALPPLPATGQVAYLEPCALSRRRPEHAAELRRRLAAVLGDRLVVLSRPDGEPLCCGAGGGYAEASPAGAKRAGARILELARDRGAAAVITTCGGCRAHLAAASPRAE